MSTPRDKTRYHLVFRPEAGNWETSPLLRLRALLKVALRRFGLRCTVCREEIEETKENT